MKFFEKNKGSISIFLILVLMPMYTCAYLVIDTARFSAAQSKLNGAMELTGNASLADYDRTLKLLYGIFAISEDESALENNLAMYFSNMIDTVGNVINTETAEFSAVYDPGSTLTDMTALESQIVNFMKYRAPYNWVAGIGQKISAFTNISEAAAVFKKSSDYFSSVSEFEKELKDIFGILEDGRLSDAVKGLSKLKKTLNGVDDASDKWKNSIESLEDGETKSLLMGEYTEAALINTEEIDSFISLLEKEMESGGESSISEYKNTPFYGYLMHMYGTGDGESVPEEIGIDLSEIAETDISGLYTGTEESRILSLISESVVKEIYKSGISDSGQIQIPEGINGNVGTGTFTAVEKLLRYFSFDAKKLLLESYEAEYFTEMFSCLTTKPPDRNLNGVEFCKTPIFGGEVEYILFGSDRKASNISSSVNLIFAVRLLMNSLYVFTNFQMRQSALAIATAASGWSGLGVSLTQTMLLLAWSMAESVLDTASLCRGETVPIYKNSSTWTLSLNNISKVLAQGAQNYACRKIDDVFFIIENAAENKTDEVKNAAVSYINSTAQGVVESLTDMIVTPVEAKIQSVLNGVPDTYSKEDIEKLLHSAVKIGENDSKGLRYAKELFIKYLAPKTAEIMYENLPACFSSDEAIAAAAAQKIRSCIAGLYGELFGMINEKAEEYESAALAELDKLSGYTSDTIKEKTVEIINKYSAELSSLLGDDTSDRRNTVSGYSAMGMTYKDYLKLFAIFQMSRDGEKREMLKRCAVIMQINCNSSLPGFDISKCYTKIKLTSKINVGMHDITAEEVYGY